MNRLLAVVLLVLWIGPGHAATLQTPEDPVFSPYTGYTRDHWLEITQQLIAGVLPYFDPELGLPIIEGVAQEPGHTRLVTRGDQHTEAYGRTLMLVAIYTAATGLDTVPGYEGSIAAPYLDGLIRGTEPTSPVRWKPSNPQSTLGTNVAMAVLLSPKYFWEPLTQQQRENVLDLLESLVERPAYDNNHWYFHMMAVPVLDKYGRRPDRPRMTRMFQRLLGWYRGDGWFIDGDNRGFDYYNLWGYHLYNHALCHFDQPWREQFGDQVRQTGHRFQAAYPYLHGRDGGPIPWGRSLTYRFASISAIGYPMLHDACALPPGQARRIASGCLKYFWDHGSLSENGLMEPGYHGPNSVVAEAYIARFSCYWAAHGLIPLVLPANHPFWTEREQPMPADESGGRVALPGGQMVLRVSPIDGEARMFPVGQPFSNQASWQRGSKYFQHAYSSFLGFALLGEGARELVAGRTGVSYDNRTWQYRNCPRPLRVDPYHCISTYDITLKGVDPHLKEFGDVITHTLIGNDGEVHVFWHTSAEPAWLTVGGYAIRVPHDGTLHRQNGESQLVISAERFHSIIKLLSGPPGDLKTELLTPRDGWNHSHLFGGKGAYPHWCSRQPVPPNQPVVVYVNGTRDRAAEDPDVFVSSEPGILRVRLEGVTHEVPIPE